MKQYSDFDQFLSEGPGLEFEARLAFTRKWLKDNYNVVSANEEWMTLLSDVHNHDDQPLHFGQIKIGTSFSAATTQLVKLHNVWHMGIIKQNSNEGAFIHPLREQNQNPENEKLRVLLSSLATSGKVVKPEPVYGVDYSAPAINMGTPDFSGPGVFQLPEPVATEEDDLENNPIKVNSETKTKSVDIDLSSLLKGI